MHIDICRLPCKAMSLVMGISALAVAMIPTSLFAQQSGVGAPRSFEAIAVSTSEIHCYWLPAEGATGYRISRDGKEIVRLPGNATDYLDSSLAPASTHRYTIETLFNKTLFNKTLFNKTLLDNSSASISREDQDRTFTPFPLKVNDGGHESQSVYDVVIVQASSGGVAAAIEAARRGLRVALIEPSSRVGGMPVNGLSSTDIRRDYHASGFLVRFADRVRQFYAREGVKTDGLRYEPRIAHMAMKSLLFEQPNITLFRHARLSKVMTVSGITAPARRRITAIQVERLDNEGNSTGERTLLKGSEFIDASDCGDLAAWAGAKFRLGREARTANEPHNGVIYYNRKDDSPLPGSTGVADKRIQAYAYLFVVKDYGANADKTIPKPPGYRREDFIHSPGWKDSWAFTSGKLPQNKYELNQHPQGGDLQEINYAYPTSSYAERARVEKLYRDHVLGYLYYIQTELGQKQLGFPDDEYRDTHGFPPLLYVREGRRIVGEQLPVEAEITSAPNVAHPESFGLGDYPMDSHAVRTKTDWNSPDMGEGEWWLYKQTPWHSLPLGILIPEGIDNLFVTTAVSSTHVSFGTYRMEPVRMQFGQAAAIAASLCIRYGRIARDIPARQVQDELLPHAAAIAPDPDMMLWYLSDVKPGIRHYREIQYLVTRGFWLGSETFAPTSPTTGQEFVKLLRLLADRSAPPSIELWRQVDTNETDLRTTRHTYFPYMGMPADRRVVEECAKILNSNTPITRLQFAHWITLLLGWKSGTSAMRLREDSGTHYSDVVPADRDTVEALFDHFIDSELWDGYGHRAPDGKLVFRPDAPLTHADLFAALYIAQIGLGPLFNDHPLDAQNGWRAPDAPTVMDTISQP